MMDLYKARQNAHEGGNVALAATIDSVIKEAEAGPNAPSPAPAASTNKSPAASAKRPAEANTMKPSAKKRLRV